MKKFLPICLVGVLLLSGFGAVALNTDLEILDSETIGYGQTGDGRNDYTHTVFVEVATGQFCGPCHSWNTNIYNAYKSGDYDFEYVEMIGWGFGGGGDILNLEAYYWASGYGITSIPTSIFDGDYRRIVGNYPNQLPGALDACGARSVKDLEASMTVAWLGDAEIQVDIEIENNEATQYNGYIRVPITEITSRYSTSGGAKYHFGFLDYAFKKDISISAGGVYTDSVTWDGDEHQDNHGDDFGDIESDNIKVIMGVFNDNNDYVDETVAATPSTSTPPETPEKPEGPTEGKVGVEYEFNSSTTDPDGDQIYYKFDWDDGTNSGWVGPFNSGQPGSASHSWDEEGPFDVKVKAKDVHGAESGWSNPHRITIFSGPRPDIDVIKGGLFKVSAKIKNIGALDASGVKWKITLDGGAFIGKETSGENLSISAGAEETIKSGLIFGFGSTRVKVRVWIPDGPSDTREQGGFVFLFFIKINPGGVI
ncbi:MAG: hypothetical protein JSW60_06355 [Thermoplasmatales archaeon]|nr:MAG: hypothetical protein JSW60_06355 [Thermoplasmatales archaeon]